MRKSPALALIAFIASACGGGGGGGSGTGSSTTAPQADAGPDHFASELAPAVLDGSGSSDSDGTIVSFLWEQLSGPAVTIDDPAQAKTSFPAPAVAEPTDFGFRLTVTDDEDASDTDEVTVTVVPEVSITLSGEVTFDLVPVAVSPITGTPRLDYGATQVTPARGIGVEVVDATDGVTVIASGRTDEMGAYSFTVPGFIEVQLRARAEMQQPGSPGWDFRVVDNTQGDALYVIGGQPFNTGGSDLTRDLHAASGWNGVSYAEPRSAAPLAILDTVYEAVEFWLTADPALQFPALDLHWSVDNRPVFGADGQPDPDSGEIGTSFFRSGADGGIFLLGAEDEDTEEYDRHVIVHEWGHYLEDVFSRSDSIGGPHTQGDQLDFRVAFGEGWGNAFSAMATGDSVYKDTFGLAQGSGFDFDAEGEGRENPGWYSEFSIHEIIYDIFDDVQDTLIGTGTDEVSLGLGPIFDVMTNAQRTTTAMTSLFPFIDALVAANPASQDAIETLLGYHAIEPVVDEYGSGETNKGNPASDDVLPVYAEVTVNGAPVEVCSTDEFSGSQTGSVNKLGSRRYLRFQAAADGTHTFTATTTAAPEGETTDPDLWLHQADLHFPSLGAPSPSCAPDNLSACTESFAVPLDGGEAYVLEVYEWTNTNASDDADNPPIGRACFDVEITQP